MRFRGVLAFLAAACFVLGASAAPAASAGTYDVTLPPCSAWGSYDSNGWGNGIYCNGYLGFQLNSNSSVTVGAPGSYMWLKSPRLPDATFLKTLKLTYLASQATGANDHIHARACQRYAGVNDAWSGAPNGACVGAVFGLPTQSAFSLLTIGEGTLACATNCGGWQLDVSAGYSSGFVWLSGIAATIGDNTAPTVISPLPNHEISEGNWLRGNVEIGATGNDASGSGIASMAFYPGDPTLTVSTSVACEYTKWVPCDTVKNWTGTFDTRTVFDGTHTGYYTATDPAGMKSLTPTFNYKVDNTKPDAPTSLAPQTSGMNGWSATNSFGANWENGAEVEETSTQSGIEKVVVDVEPTDASAQTDPAPVTVPVGSTVGGISATRTSVEGVTVPAVGRYVLGIQLVDRAGNVSDADVGSVVSIGFDPSAPAKPSGQSSMWISRDKLAAGYDQGFTLTQLPGGLAPICGFSYKISDQPLDEAPTFINVPGGSTARKLRLPGSLSEATHFMHLRSISCNGMPSVITEHVEIKVDRTDPTASVSGIESGHWYREGQIVELRGFDALSGMEAAPSEFPVSTDGAFISYAINGTGPSDESAPRGGTALVPVSGEGEKRLEFAPVDVAGNRAVKTSIAFGIDATRPTGYINRQEASRPAYLSAPIWDAVSGIRFAQFAIRGPGTRGDWITLPTSLVDENPTEAGAVPRSAIASAHFPDTSMARGVYAVRIIARDEAGNELDSSNYHDGLVATVTNPMRARTAISSSLLKGHRSCSQKRCVVTRCSTQIRIGCYKKVRGKFALVGGSKALSVAYNRGAIVSGVLTDTDGRPLPNQEVTVSTVEPTSRKAERLGTATTSALGVYAIRVPPGMNRVVNVTYLGSDLREDARTSSRLFTQAKLTLKLDRTHARTGQSVTFSGRVTSSNGVIPPGGKIVALQFHAAGRWRPAVAVAHTRPNGTFRIRYRFDGRRVKARIVFRVTAPSENGWGHTASASKPAIVRIN